MEFTIADLFARVREILNDADGDRYTDASLYRYLDEANSTIRRLRPDIYVYSFNQAFAPSASLDELIQFPEAYVESVSYFIAGRAELRDDEFAVDGRAMTLMGKLESVLLRGF